MTDELETTTFEERAAPLLRNRFLRQAIPNAVDHTQVALQRIFADADREALRDRGRDIRAHAVANLASLVGRFADACEANGARVHFAADADEARRIVDGICRAAGASRIVKSKSMASEECELTPFLERAGYDVVETDLGEYVVQLDGDRPSHVIAPIIHKTRGEVRSLFSRLAGEELPDDPAALTGFARERLREKFLRADVGITGGNFGVAETGTIALVTNEGNGRLGTALPRVHIALMGVEKVVPRLEDLAVLLPLLVGHGTGQRLSTYVTLAHGPRRESEPDGPDEMHVVLLDAGRGAVASSDFAEVLQCIRCGACQNVCPVYRQVGGHAYGWVYGGPIGAVLTPLFRGQEAGGEVPHASSLCAACDDVCPVRIPLHELLLKLRRERVHAGVPARGERLAYRLWSIAWSTSFGYRLSARLGRIALRPLARGGAVRRGPSLLGRFARGRDLPLPAARPFHRRGPG
jgi:L-lactate dehydrogenase complex protein LldF